MTDARLGGDMLRTISLSSCISVQGIVVGKTQDGKLLVRVDDKTFVGYPVSAAHG
jgi:hypothetical protein